MSKIDHSRLLFSRPCLSIISSASAVFPQTLFVIISIDICDKPFSYVIWETHLFHQKQYCVLLFLFPSPLLQRYQLVPGRWSMSHDTIFGSPMTSLAFVIFIRGGKIIHSKNWIKGKLLAIWWLLVTRERNLVQVQFMGLDIGLDSCIACNGII